ncbi:hypothetical protein BpHYR1_024178 [Brachionus plicatilis]|uniref:Uncharacterized protein n=1 Tax=Brachionus plicatilis TaxID=10195 RepID=A0A3M7SDP9_BRAPC|nr:hypothetical protein BpHYR1_024178 [Brachionus plicatilis]
MDLYKLIIIDPKKKCFCGLNFRNDDPKTYSKRHVDRVKQNIETVLTDFDDKISEGGFKLHKVEIIDVKLSDIKFKNPFTLFFTTDEQNNYVPLELLYFKDRWNIADHVYQSLTNTFNLRLPTLYRVFVAAKKRNEEQLLWFLEHLKDLDSISSLKVKLSADGTNAIELKHRVAITPLAYRYSHYNRLKEPFKYLLEQIKDFSQLEFKNRKFDVKFYFCSDWKLTATALGLNAAKSGYPCIWVSDVLNRLLVRHICSHDNIGKNNKIYLPKHKYLAIYIQFFQEKCRIKVDHFETPVKGNVTPDFVGDEKERISEIIDFINDFQSIVKIDSIHKLWVDFYEIYYLLKDNAIMPYLMKKKTIDWLELFLKIYLSTHLTPYIHAFTTHLFQFQRVYGDINLFNLQGLEKLNDQTTNEYFKSSNKGPKTMVQLILRRLRMDHFMNHSNQPIN